MPPGVPVAFPPFNTRPSTLKETCPVERLTLALPPVVLQGVVPGLIPATASLLETVILPTIVFQRTTLPWWSCAKEATASSKTNNTAHTFFIGFSSSPWLSCLKLGLARSDHLPLPA